MIDTTPLALLLALLISWTPLTYAKDLSDEVVPGEFSTGQIAEVDLAPALRALGNRLYDDSVFDGDWYSPALHLGVRIDAKTGTITVSNSPKLHSGDAALTLQSIKRGYRVFPANKLVALPWFDGRHVHPDGSWFKGESIDYVKRQLYHGNARIYEFMDPVAVRTLVDEHLEGRQNRRLLIWSLLNLEKWCEKFVV